MPAFRTQVGALVVALVLGSCVLNLDPVTNEARQTSPASDETKRVIFSEPVVWLNGPKPNATRGVRLPEGTYELVAEDSEYSYFQAPHPIEVHLLDKGTSVERRDVPGGLAVANGFNMVPAATYLDDGPGQRTLIMKHGSGFLRLEDDKWRKTF